MSLKEYVRKRDFRKTAEPKRRAAPRASGHRFVVQKHAASRLHYDFRLELDGTLKSWAVPKGVPYKKGERRLAVHVEDHPVSFQLLQAYDLGQERPPIFFYAFDLLQQEQEFVIGGYTPPGGSRTHFGALLVGCYEGAELKFAGKVGTGFNAKPLRTLHARFEGIATDACPFVDLPEKRGGRYGQGVTAAVMRRCHWVKPELVCQIKFAEWTRDDRLRQPVFLGLRADKPAREVVREKA